MSGAHLKRFFKIDSMPDETNKWRLIFEKASGDYCYQVVVQNVPSFSNNHYHIFLYVSGRATGYIMEFRQGLPPVWDKLEKMDFHDYVSIQKMMNKRFFVDNNLTPPELDENREGKFIYYLAEPPSLALAKASRGEPYSILCLPAESEKTVVAQNTLVEVNPNYVETLTESVLNSKT